jgi:hypothetical protein
VPHSVDRVSIGCKTIASLLLIINTPPLTDLYTCSFPNSRASARSGNPYLCKSGGVDHPRSSAKLSSFRVFSRKVEESSSTVLAFADDPKIAQPCDIPTISTWRSEVSNVIDKEAPTSTRRRKRKGTNECQGDRHKLTLPPEEKELPRPVMR